MHSGGLGAAIFEYRTKYTLFTDNPSPSTRALKPGHYLAPYYAGPSGIGVGGAAIAQIGGHCRCGCCGAHQWCQPPAIAIQQVRINGLISCSDLLDSLLMTTTTADCPSLLLVQPAPDAPALAIRDGEVAAFTTDGAGSTDATGHCCAVATLCRKENIWVKTHAGAL
jgi:hypothetical protein